MTASSRFTKAVEYCLAVIAGWLLGLPMALPARSGTENALQNLPAFYNEHGPILVAGAVSIIGSLILTLLIAVVLVARRRADLQLRDSQRLLALTLDAVSEAVWDWDLHSGRTEINARYYEMLGYEPYAFSTEYETWKTFVHPDDLPSVEQAFYRHVETGATYQAEYRMRKKSGDWCWILARGMIVERDVSGTPLRMVGTFADVSERKQAELELKASEERYRALVELMGEGLVVLDQETRVTYANPQFRLMTGFSEEELPGIPLAALLSKKGKAIFRHQIEQRRDGTCERYELEWQHKDGGLIETLIAPKPLYDAEGCFVGSFAAISDITERKQAERALIAYRDHLEDLIRERTADLEHAREVAESANRAKSAFLANMSHELRTPLNAILGFSTLLSQDPAVTASQRKILSIINRSGEHLLALINDILDMAKIEAGRMHIRLVPFNLATLAQDVINMMQARALEKDLQLRLELPPDLPPLIHGEEAKLRQVLVNLLSNAVKFTHQGHVVLRLATRAQADGLWLRLDVEDTGPGINPEDQARIFEPFVQLGEVTGYKGTGLGLAITRQFVELMGGQIHLTSSPGHGSYFQIELPIQPMDSTEMPIKPARLPEVSGLAPGQPDYRILAVEDHPDNALLLRLLLEAAGFQIHTVANGPSAIEQFRQWRPHLIWMDWRMPDMDGLEATRRIRQMEGGDQVRIVALTASVFIEQHQKIQGAGIDEILHKPYTPQQLFDCLARQLDVRYTYKAPVTESEPTPALVTTQLARLAQLPVALRCELTDALVHLDTARISALIARIGAQDADLGNALREQADSFDYALIEDALRIKP